MKRVTAILLWSLVLLGLLLGADQYFLRAAPASGPLATVRAFYLDLRSRLLTLGDGEKAVVQTPPKKRPAPAVKPSSPRERAPAAPVSSPRFVFVDDRGEIHFADSLDEVPPSYRSDTRSLDR